MLHNVNFTHPMRAAGGVRGWAAAGLQAVCVTVHGESAAGTGARAERRALIAGEA